MVCNFVHGPTVASDAAARANNVHAVCGEVGLTGEVRAISQITPRIKEAERLGFSQCILPEKNLKGLPGSSKMKLIGVQSIKEAIEHLFKK